VFDNININTLQGKTLTEVINNNDNEILFTTTEGKKYRMHHSQDCCESVSIDDINGDLNDLVGTPIVLAEERNSDDVSKEQQLRNLIEGDPLPPCNSEEDELWTFYEFQTIKGSVNIRWYGTSNGYYSISVSFEEVPNK